jgi:hypothetical protein
MALEILRPRRCNRIICNGLSLAEGIPHFQTSGAPPYRFTATARNSFSAENEASRIWCRMQLSPVPLPLCACSASFHPLYKASPKT